MEVRATRAFRYSGKSYHVGDVISLDPGRALIRLQEGSVEPAIELEPFRPSMDDKGLTIWGAYRLHVHNFPPLKPLLAKADSGPQPYRLRICRFLERPKWVGFPAGKPKDAAWRRRNAIRKVPYWDSSVNVYVGPFEARANSGPSLQERYQNALRNHFLHAAIHFFIQRLADRELDATGVGEGDLKTLKESKIPAGWWRRDIELNLRRNEVWELMGPKSEKPVRRYSEVRIQKPTASQKSSGQGRRSKKDKLLQTFHELWENGFLTIEDLRSKKGVRNKVLEQLGYSDRTPGCSYNTFVEHVGPEIDKILQTRDSEN